MYIHATGTGHGLVAPLALCLRPARKTFSKIVPLAICGIHPIKKVLENVFSGVEKCLPCRGSGHAPRATSQIPGTADHCKWALWFAHVIASQVVNPCLQWYLKIGFC